MNRPLLIALRAAEGYLELEMPEHALAALRALREPTGAPFDFHRLRADAYRALAQWQAALEDFERCHTEQPKNVEVLMGLAWCYKRTDQLPKAIAAMHAAHRADGKEPIILYNLACYYALAKNKSQSLSWLGRALRMHRGLVNLIADESDFDPLRQDPDFRRLLELVHDAAAPPKE
jgi:Flp pilus assembly protein TadD